MIFYSRPLLYRVHHKWHSARHCQTRRRPIGRCHNYYQEEKIEITWVHHKSQQSFPCNPKRFHLREKKRRQTERKKLADIITEWMGKSFTETLAHSQDIWRELIKVGRPYGHTQSWYYWWWWKFFFFLKTSQF